MAVYAAHITRTLQGTPSVFQVAAQEALGATVKPALRKLIEYLAAVYPNKCSWCERWYDELYLLFDACLQYHYLKHYAASFSESFYGLLRVPLSTSSEFSSGQRLPELIERGSLLLLVMVPYLRDKVEQVIDRWRDDKEDGKLGKSSADRLRLAAIRVHTVCAVVYQCVRLATLARYVARAGRSPGPGLALLGLALRDAPPREDADSWLDLGKTLRNGQFGAALTFPALGGALLQGAQYGAFAVQVLRGWRARASCDHAALPAPPPPHRDEKALRWKNKCPLCLRTWKIPTVLPVSGYIFCYPCISRELRARTRCPVTGAPAAPADLVRLYIE